MGILARGLHTLTSIDVLWYSFSMNTTNHPVPVIQDPSCCTTPQTITLSVERAVHLAVQLKALADPTRLRILDLLAEQQEPVCVCDITDQFDQHQPTISHHLRLLRQAGLVDCEKRGVWAFYWATDLGREQLAQITNWK